MRKFDEWCYTCKEYNLDKHCCPRFNRVIRETVMEVKQNAERKWIPVTERLPEEKREVLFCTNDEFIYIGEYEKWTWADGLGTWSESVEYRTISDVVAWMPLPDPWKE